MTALAHSLPFQPSLFGDAAMACFVDDDARQKAARSAVGKLLKVKRSFEGDELRFLAHVTEAIERIRLVSRLSDHQREEVVLYAIERQGASTVLEIAEDCRLDKRIVVEILRSLAAQGLVYQVERACPMTNLPQHLIKSARMKLPEASGMITTAARW